MPLFLRITKIPAQLIIISYNRNCSPFHINNQIVQFRFQYQTQSSILMNVRRSSDQFKTKIFTINQHPAPPTYISMLKIFLKNILEKCVCSIKYVRKIWIKKNRKKNVSA